MSAIERHTDPTSLVLRGLSERECARFRNRNLRQPGRKRVVHLVELRDWIAGLQLPAPACHQPVASFALSGEAYAVLDEVTCGKCRALGRHRTAPLIALDGGQLTFDLDNRDNPPGSVRACPLLVAAGDASWSTSVRLRG